MEANPLGGVIQVSSSLGTSRLSEVHSVFSNRNLPYISWEGGGNKGKSESLYCFRSLLHNPDQQLKGPILMPGVGVLLCSLWFLEETLSAYMENFHFNYIYAFHSPT